MRRMPRLAVVTLGLLSAAGCATMNVSSHVARGVDFARYHTYDWGPADSLPTGDARLDGNPFFRDHFQGAVDKRLPSRGLTRGEGRPDLYLHYHASITEAIDVDRIDREHGYCYTDDCQAGTIAYEADTLILDFVDARTNRVVWRGWAQDDASGILKNPESMQRKIDEAVTRMLDRLPHPF